jgi:ubiquinone/menaquinone biosynthesis C-methylase UbiE
MGTHQTSHWIELWQSQMTDMAARSTTDYWNRRAVDYNDFITTSRFDYGEQMASILVEEGVVRPPASVLEIASGVGAVTLPLASRAFHLTALEPAEAMARLLQENIRANGADNVGIVVEDFATYAAKAEDDAFDLVLLCHAAWQFPNIVRLVREMSRLSRSFCCLADTMGTGYAGAQDLHHRLSLKTPTLDRSLYLFNVLHELGCPANLAPVRHLMRRSSASARAMWTNLVSKYREVSPEDERIIDDHVASRCVDGIYQSPGTIALMWWRVS